MRIEDRVENLEREVAWLRKRLAHLLPERRYCRYCRAIIHKDAEACGSCGRTLGPVADPKKGLPG